MSRLGRALIEIALKGHEQAKAQLTEIKGELKDLSSGSATGVGPGQKGLDDLKAQFARVRGEVDALGKSSQAVGAGGVSAFAGMGVALTGIGAIIGGTIWAFEKYEQKLRDVAAASRFLQDEREATRLSLNDIRALIAGHSELERAKQKNREAEEQEKGNLFDRPDWKKLSAQQQMEAIDEVRTRHSKQRVAIEELFDKTSADNAQKRADADMRVAERLTISRLDGIERINAEQEAANRELAEREKATTNENELAALAKRKAASDEYFAYERMKWGVEQADRETKAQQAEDEKQRRDEEAAQRLADATSKAFERVWEKSREDLAKSISDALRSQQSVANSSLNQLNANVTNLASIVQARLRSSGVNMAGDGQPYGRN